MLRRLIAAAALCLLAVLGPAHALGLGEIKVASKLNQRFSAVIPFTSLSADEAANVRARLADNSAFARAGMDRSAYLSSIQIEAITEGSNPRIVLRSSELAREPLLNLMVEVSTPGGPRILREYTVFLDPAVSAPTPAPVAKPQPLPEGATAAASKDEFFQTQDETSGASSVAPTASAAAADATRHKVRAGETLSVVAQTVKPSGVGLEQAMLALYEANPGAFINGSIDQLRKGATLKVPSVEQMQSTRNSAARARISALSAQASSASPVATANPVDPLPDPVLTPPPAVTSGPVAGDASTSAAPAGTAPGGTPADATAGGPAAPAGDTAPPPPVETPVVAPVAPVAEEVVAPVTADPAATAPVASADSGGMMGLLIPAVIGLLVLLIAIGAFRAIRERRAQREYEDASRATSSLPVARVGAKGAAAAKKSARAELEELDRNIEGGDDDATRVAAADDDSTRLDADATGPYPRYSGDALAPRKPDKAEMEVTSQFAANTTQIDLGDNDPMSEADFHLAYGLYDEAALMLQQAAAREPNRAELKVKLAETYFAAGKPREFEQIATLLNGKLDAEAWGKIAIMGRQLCPDSALFADSRGGDTDMALDMAFDDDATTIAPVAVDKGLEFSLEELELPSQSGKSAAKDSSTLEFDLGEFDLGGADTKPQKMQSTSEINLKDFDLGGTDLAGPGKSNLDIRLDEIDPLVLDDGSDDDTLSGDDASTKLDLARAYVEMGDSKMARSLLDEVEESGTADQKREAASLRERLLG